MKKLLIVLLLSGCTVARLDLPDGSHDVAGANPRVWNRPISFGPWQTRTVNEGTTRSWLASIAGIQIGRADQAYRLTLEGGDGATRVDCHTKEFVVGRNGFFADPTFGDQPLLLCGFERYDARDVLVLGRTGRVEPALAGEIRDADDAGAPALLIRSLHRPQGAAFPSGDPFGYEITRDGRRVAAVETMNRGRVWIDPSVDGAMRKRIAAAAAALLLFNEPGAGE